MGAANPEVDACFDGPWRAERLALRRLLLESPLEEALKWRQPCYGVSGGNVVIIHAFRDHCALGFFKGALLSDPAGILVQPGENSQASRQARFRSLDEIAALKAVLGAYIREAVEIERSGRKVDFAARNALVLPGELVARLAADAELQAAFAALTPGRQRGYAMHIAQSRQSATRAARVEKCRPRILAGKGMNDR